MCISLEFCNVFCKAFEAAGPIDPMIVTAHKGFEFGLVQRQQCLHAPLRESTCRQQLVSGLRVRTFPSKREHNAFRFDDFAIGVCLPMFLVMR
jgi:hypothetical protein